MKTLVTTLALLTLIGCEAAVDSTSQSVGTMTCPAGQMPYTYIPAINPRTAEAVSQIGSENGYLNLKPETNKMTVQSATCRASLNSNVFYVIERPNGPNVSGIVVVVDGGVDITTAMKERCDGKQNCRVAETVRYCKSEPRDTYDGNVIRFEYTCSLAPDVVKVGYQTKWNSSSFGCLPPEETVHSACIPENCYGHTRRNRLLDCVPDFVKPIEPKDNQVVMTKIARPLGAPGSNNGSAYTPTGPLTGIHKVVLDEGQLYEFRGSVYSDGALKQNLALWLSSTVPQPGQSAPSLEIFRCAIGHIDLGKYTPITVGAKKRIDFVEQLRVPLECRDGDTFKDVVRAGWLAESLAADAGTPPSSAATQLNASYDLEDHAILSEQGKAIDSTCNTKPIDLFFNHSTKVHKAFDYYSQNKISLGYTTRVTTNPIEFNSTPATVVGARQVNVRDMEYLVNKAGRPKGEVAADLTLAMSGPGQPQWAALMLKSHQYYTGETFARNSLSLDTYNPFAPSISTGLLPVPDTAAKDADGNVQVDATGLIRLPASKLNVVLSGVLNETGSTAELHVPINNDVRRALFNHPRYPLATGGTRNYVLQVCPSNKVQVFNVLENTLQNEYLLKPPNAPDLFTASNGCARSAVFAFRGENVVTPIPEVEVGDGELTDLNPTTSGEDRLAATFDADTDRQCVGNRCQTTVSNGLAGSDNPAKRTVLSIDNEEEEDDSTNKFSTGLNILGFNVIEASKTGNIGPVKTHLTIAPNYGAIAALFPKPAPSSRLSRGASRLASAASASRSNTPCRSTSDPFKATSSLGSRRARA